MKGDPIDNTPAQVGRLLRALASLVEKSSHHDVAALLRGQAILAKVDRHKKEDTAQSELLPPTPPPNLAELSEKLHALSSREDGLSLLSASSLTRRDLEKLGRIVGVPIMKTDNMERLTEKIIETCIGSRLSSEAIRGDRPKA
jgi:hypothetical protein